MRWEELTGDLFSEAVEKADEKPAVPAVVETGADLMPEDFRQPKAIAKPKKVDVR